MAQNGDDREKGAPLSSGTFRRAASAGMVSVRDCNGGVHAVPVEDDTQEASLRAAQRVAGLAIGGLAEPGGEATAIELQKKRRALPDNLEEAAGRFAEKGFQEASDRLRLLARRVRKDMRLKPSLQNMDGLVQALTEDPEKWAEERASAAMQRLFQNPGDVRRR